MTAPALATLTALRDLARSRVAEEGFPTARDEEWKYTNVAPIAETRWEPGPLDLVRRVRPGAALSPVRLVFVNGRLATGLSTVGELPPGVVAEDAANAPELLERILARDAHGTAFEALNVAEQDGGALLRVPAGLQLAVPIELLFLVAPTDRPTAAHPRSVVELEEGARAHVIERHEAAWPGVALTNAVTDARVGAGAGLDWDLVVEPGDGRFHVRTLRVEQERDSRFAARSFLLSGRLVRDDLSVTLAAPGAECELLGLSVTRGEEQADSHVTVRHASPRCRSRQLYKGVLSGASRTVFDGKIVVERNAAKTDAQQTNKNLLLSDDAVIFTKPNLRIYADDVKCAHGAAVGRLDEAALFYLRSRGIGEREARSLLTFAFASEVPDRVPHAALREELRRVVRERLDLGLRGGGA